MNDEVTTDSTEEGAAGDNGDQRTRQRPSKRRAVSDASDSSTGSSSSGRTSSPKSVQSSSRRTIKRVRPMKAAEQAVEQFGALANRRAESVVGVEWDENEWVVRLEVVESPRVPETADLMAEYEVRLDAHGELQSYSRKDRYVRGRPSE